MKCKKCDAELRDNAKFCDNCGEMVVKAEPAYTSTKLMDVKPIAKPLDEKKNEPVENTSTSEKKETTKMTICIVLAVVVSILGLASCGNCVCSDDKSKDKQTLSVGTITESTTEETTEEFTTEEPTTEEPTTEEPTTEEPTTEKPTEPPTEEPTEFTDTLTELYSNDDVNVYYSRTKSDRYSLDEVEVYFYVENKTDMQLKFQADAVTLDGICYNDVIMSDPISAGTIGEIKMNVDDCSNSNPSSVGADLRYFNSEHDYRQEIQIGSKDID